MPELLRSRAGKKPRARRGNQRWSLPSSASKPLLCAFLVPSTIPGPKDTAANRNPKSQPSQCLPSSGGDHTPTHRKLFQETRVWNPDCGPGAPETMTLGNAWLRRAGKRQAVAREGQGLRGQFSPPCRGPELASRWPWAGRAKAREGQGCDSAGVGRGFRVRLPGWRAGVSLGG